MKPLVTLALLLGLIAVAAPQKAQAFSFSYLLFTADGAEDGKARGRLVVGESGQIYKSSLIESATLGRFMTHHIWEAGYKLHRYLRRSPQIGARQSYRVYAVGRKLRAASSGAGVSKLGLPRTTLVVDGRDPSDIYLITLRLGDAGGPVYLSDVGQKVDVTVEAGDPVTRVIDGLSFTFGTRVVRLGASEARLLYDEGGACVGAELHGLTAILESLVKTRRAAKALEEAEATPSPEAEGEDEDVPPEAADAPPQPPSP
jgi:hypothetical protein